MDVRSIIADIDAEIAKLQGVKATLTGLSGSAPGVAKTTGRRGRPKGSKNVTTAAKAAKAVKIAKPAKATKRKLSPEGRKRIAEAMKRRWAERRKEAGK
jgi:acyl-CoA reductase-like NAD-dependent aldehyde dehydrogenase